MLEIRRSYSFCEKKGELATATFCSKVTDSGPRLKREDYYYTQLVGLMRISGLRWGDLVVYGIDYILIEWIQLNKAEWNGMIYQLNYFYFNTLLPFTQITEQ